MSHGGHGKGYKVSTEAINNSCYLKKNGCKQFDSIKNIGFRVHRHIKKFTWLGESFSPCTDTLGEKDRELRGDTAFCMPHHF